jgi:ATPase subunit of ABC transporter with duplicated ATPase domains
MPCAGIIWLENFLQQWPKTIILVSHDRNFLNTVCDRIMLIFGGKMEVYKGNYDTFEAARTERMKQLRRKSRDTGLHIFTFLSCQQMEICCPVIDHVTCVSQGPPKLSRPSVLTSKASSTGAVCPSSHNRFCALILRQRFRFNAKRASLVQSRIKAMERMEVQTHRRQSQRNGPRVRFTPSSFRTWLKSSTIRK